MEVLLATEKTKDTLKYAHNQQVVATGQNKVYKPPINSARIYKGYFKPIKTGSDEITIVDGFDHNLTGTCGNVSVNKLAIAPVSATTLTITADAYIYLECVTDDDPMTSSTNTIVQYATEQSWETGKEKILISRVTFSGTTITDFTRESVSGRIDIKGVCD